MWVYFFVLFFWPSEGDYHLVIAPQSPVVEIGTNFTATCMIINTTEVTADDLFWKLSETTVPKEQYMKISRSTACNKHPCTRVCTFSDLSTMEILCLF
uniref:Immunoglobulin C2-set-like ligand-binding domain-containing protein n=1 Tax=Amphilophus citrinellus TaxID=61819 RepID=A0A3Q0RNS2_AMPCI